MADGQLLFCALLPQTKFFVGRGNSLPSSRLIPTDCGHAQVRVSITGPGVFIYRNGMEWNSGMTMPTKCFVTTYTIVFAHWSSQIMDKAVAAFKIKKDEHKTDPGEE